MNIDVYPEYKITNLLFSGGMDSTILLYLLAKDIHQNNYDIKIVCNVFGSAISKKNLLPIISYVTTKFPTVEIKLSKIKKLQWIREVVENILNIYGGVVYSGCNKVVEDKFIPTKYIPFDTPPVRGDPLNDYHIRPFIHMDKVELMDIYIQEGIVDLIPLTNSCGVNSDSHCGECYFCMERDWAKNTLGLSDIN